MPIPRMKRRELLRHSGARRLGRLWHVRSKPVRYTASVLLVQVRFPLPKSNQLFSTGCAT
jgi:hypothetical protein